MKEFESILDRLTIEDYQNQLEEWEDHSLTTISIIKILLEKLNATENNPIKINYEDMKMVDQDYQLQQIKKEDGFYLRYINKNKNI
jgi:hypothetical protein